MGGKRSEVKAVNGAATAFQHDATVQANGTITLFDNGAVPKVHPQSRAIVVSVNAHARTDTLLARFPEHPRGTVLRQPGQRAGAARRQRVRRLGLGSRTSRNSAPPGSCCMTRTGTAPTSPTVPTACSLDGHARQPPRSRASATSRERAGKRVRELERRHRSRELARARGRLTHATGAGGERREERVRDNDRHTWGAGPSLRRRAGAQQRRDDNRHFSDAQRLDPMSWAPLG